MEIQSGGARSASDDPRRILTSLGVVVYDWDVASDRIDWGPNAADVLGAGNVALWSSGRSFDEAVSPGGGPTRAEIAVPRGSGDDGAGTVFAVLYRLRLADGTFVLVDDSGRWFADAQGRPARVHGTMRIRPDGQDATDFARARLRLLEEVDQDIRDGRPSGQALTLFVIAMSNLADLNEELGFEAADDVLGSVIARLGGTMRRRDRFARYAGNRFALALRGCGPDEAEIAARRLLDLATREPVGTTKGPVEVQVAIGAASAPAHAIEAPLLLRRAETMLSIARMRPGRPYLMFDQGLLRTAARHRGDPVLAGVDLLNARRVVLARQPVVSATTREEVFSEALLRVADEDGTLRAAADIIPALEQAGLIHLADVRMLELVADHLDRYPSARLSLNVSPRTMERSDWLPILKAHLGGRLGLASRLILEVTETAAIRDPKAMRVLLDGVRALGAAVALDDFGAGHTSFRNLRAFPVDFVKIDGAFVQNLARSPDDRFFVRTLVDLARHLGIATVAEWVEDEESAVLLASWGTDLLQGNHCGRPRIGRTDMPDGRALVA
ncbi:bifunctional diguanylate cyclase/phosphodiesterase [Enterovirga rhinocerotis]|uniref:bifunctional diguanylate cyclase/phosphodiesterase n=1 Tax=Enterovirga rhinocerotis TaxID=1339210 RepID=UPI00105B43F0|nr:bifunctional diguanylate cyclase/phosphodiesterase [Enterovirga rhinocerotis]